MLLYHLCFDRRDSISLFVYQSDIILQFYLNITEFTYEVLDL